MTLYDLMKDVTIQGKVHLVVFDDAGNEKEHKIIGWTDGLCNYDSYHMGGGEWIYTSDYEDMEVTYIYSNGDGVTIELKEAE